MRLNNLQALRGVACLLVVFYHVALWEHDPQRGGNTSYALFGPVEYFGYVGVDLFFVLSGFVITWGHVAALGDPTRIAGYLRGRFWRVYPVYWACWLAAAPMYLWLINWGWHLDRRAVVRYLLLLPTDQVNAFIPQAWTLTFEMMFYTAFAVFFLLPRRAFVPALAFWLATIVAGPLVLSRLPLGLLYHTAYRLLCPKTVEFVVGCLGAVAVRRGWGGSGRIVLTAGVVGFVAAAMANVVGRVATPTGWPQAICFGVPLALIIFGAATAERSRGWQLPGWLQSVGGASYSIYLVHIAGFDAAHRLLPRMNHEGVGHWLWDGSLLVAGIGIGYLVHYAVERPLQRIGRRKKASPEPIELRRAA